MKDIMIYKNMIGSVHYSTEDEVFYGKIEGIEDSVSFEGTSVEELKNSFHEAVDDYLELCEINNRAPQKTYKGSFNIRISPELHRKAAREATLRGISLNQFIENAIREKVR